MRIPPSVVDRICSWMLQGNDIIADADIIKMAVVFAAMPLLLRLKGRSAMYSWLLQL